MKQKVFRLSLYLAWVVSLIATLASLYYSEIAKIPPCQLCWYQRICLFPLVFILAVAAYREERNIALYVYPQVFLGFVLAGIHFLYPYWNPWGQALCGTASCYEPSYTFLRLPLPFWSMGTFILLGIFLRLSAYQEKKNE